MIEELCEYLMRHGYQKDIADDIHNAYVRGGLKEALDWFEWANDDEHDSTGELRNYIENWREEAGEK